MSIRHNSSQSQKTQAFRNVIRRGVYCQTQHNTDFLYVLCLELRSPKTTQMPVPRGEARLNSHVYNVVFWDPVKMLV